MDRDAVWHHRHALFGVRLLSDDGDALEHRLSARAAPRVDELDLHRQLESPLAAGRESHGGNLQHVRRDARHDHGVPRYRAARFRGLRKLRHAPPDRRGGHGFPQAQHGFLLGLSRRRSRHVCLLLHGVRSREIRLDELLAARRFRRRTDREPMAGRADPMVAGPSHAHHLLAAGLGQFHHHDHQPPRPRHDLDAPALLRLGNARHCLPAPARVSSA